MPRKQMGDVIVMLPGITGSVLQKDGKDVWAPTAGAAVGALFSLGKNIKSLALKDDPPDADDLGDGVVATRVMPDIHLIPGFWKIDGYSKLKNYVVKTFDVKLGENLFEFAYDWRRDNRASARKLQRSADDWLKSWRASSGNKDAKLILVGHSMGGVVSRYYLECLDGWRDTRTLVTFGTPYRGSLNAVGTLSNGMEKKIGPIALDLSTMARSFTSIYQLLPVYPCVETRGGLVRVAETDVPNIDRQRAASARGFHEEIRLAVEQHEQDEEYLHGRYAIRPVIGTFQPTAQSAKTHGDGVQLIKSYEGEDIGGDGTVPRVSATPIEVEHEENAMFAAQRHASLQNDDPVLTQLAGVLSGLHLDLASFRGPPTVGLSLDIEDVYETREPVTIRARPEKESTDALLAVVEDASRPPDSEQPLELARAPLRPAGDGWHSVEIPPLPDGAYRVTVLGSGMVEPVADVFAVVSAAAVERAADEPSLAAVEG
ncbi:MAG: esterase/lipase family protein [Gaiellaceae bacterium]